MSQTIITRQPNRLVGVFNDPLDEYLTRITEKIQLTESQYKRAEQSYLTIARWLAEDGSPLAYLLPSIYPQGSIRHGTTNRPKGRVEFDVDLVCEFGIDGRLYYRTPKELLDVIEKRLREHGLYRDIIERMGRCIRINYVGDFHLDILPAFPHQYNGTGAIIIPDEDLNAWMASNPEGFARWFESQANQYDIRSFKSIDALPDQEEVEAKSPLKRVVQLVKRARDVAYSTDGALREDRAPASIVLTTLAAEGYTGTSSVAQALGTFFEGLVSRVLRPGHFEVRNPVNTQEVFSEQWSEDPVSYAQFVTWAMQMNAKWKEIETMRGIHNVAEGLKSMFGEVALDAISQQGKDMKLMRDEGRVAVDHKTGHLIVGAAASSTAMARSTFFGR